MLTSGVACPRSREAKPGLHPITFTSTQFLILLSLPPPPQTTLLAARDVKAGKTGRSTALSRAATDKKTSMNFR